MSPTRLILKLDSGRTWLAESVDRPRGRYWQILNEASEVQDEGHDRVLDEPDGTLVFDALGEFDLASAWRALRSLTRAPVDR